MAIPTSRTKEVARIIIDEEKCNGCGLCVDVCKDFSLTLKDGKVTIAEKPLFGCMACGHCAAVCNRDAIHIDGRLLSPGDIIPMPSKEGNPSFESLLNLLKRRRSNREFKDTPVEPELIEKVLEAARTAPMGLPPSDVHVVVLASKEKVRSFSEDYCAYLENLKWMVSGWFLFLMRPFLGKANHELFRDFLRPLVYEYTGEMKKGVDIVTYNAPVALYFYATPYADPADPVIVATYAMIAAESLGLGTCMLGGIHPMIQNGKAAAKFREKWGIRYKSREGLFVIMGYPRIRFHSAIRRDFADETLFN
jgi:nitroreductase/NAD-dependent dihydropyrimidine dehydrogenase PreA subunit